MIQAAHTFGANRVDARALQCKAHRLIPGGCHAYDKGDDQYPTCAPPFLVRGRGCHVTDVEGRTYIEYGAGLRSVTLGHAFESVVEAAYQQMHLGSNFNRPTPIEVECAEAVLALFPTADMVKFAKNGSDATTAAVKLARAHTSRDMVAVCADHPFFSSDDWFLGSTELGAGIPPAVRELTVTFRYNDPTSLTELLDRYPDRIACVMMEAATTVEPENDFPAEVRRICTERGVVMVLDEVTTGFRWALGGAQRYYGVEPDLTTLGKGMANGFALSALLGKREFMERGGLEHEHPRVFLLSTTNGAETHAMAAAIETIRVYRHYPVIEGLYRAGARLKEQINRASRDLGIGRYFEVVGKPSNLVYITRDQDGRPSRTFRTLFLQETIRRGVLAPSFVVSYSHGDSEIERTIEAVAEALVVYKQALREGVERHLVGPSVKPVNRRFN